MLWITLKAGDLSHKLDFWHTGSLPTCLKENLKYLCFPSLHIWSWWQLRAFKTNMHTSEMYKRNFLVKVLFITHEGVWQFRGQTQESNTGSCLSGSRFLGYLTFTDQCHTRELSHSETWSVLQTLVTSVYWF